MVSALCECVLSAVGFVLCGIFRSVDYEFDTKLCNSVWYKCWYNILNIVHLLVINKKAVSAVILSCVAQMYATSLAVPKSLFSASLRGAKFTCAVPFFAIWSLLCWIVARKCIYCCWMMCRCPPLTQPWVVGANYSGQLRSGTAR